MTIAVHQTRPAAPSTAGWVRALLDPAVRACRITTAPPIELRSTGAWRGWCSTDLLETPDRRVAVSNRVVFFSAADLVILYLHETAHRLLLDVDRAHSFHCPVFFPLQMVLLHRLDSSLDAISRTCGWSNAAQFYDLQDPPACLSDRPRSEWLPQCLVWAMNNAADLAATELTAEVCATVLFNRFGEWVAALENEPVLQAAAGAQAQRVHEAALREVEGLRSLSRVFCMAASMGWGLFLMSFTALILVALR